MRILTWTQRDKAFPFRGILVAGGHVIMDAQGCTHGHVTNQLREYQLQLNALITGAEKTVQLAKADFENRKGDQP